MDLPEWQPSFPNDEHFAMTIIAPRRTGKSYFIRHIFNEQDFNRKFDLHVVFSQSLSNQISVDFYADFVPGSYMFDDATVIPEVMKRLFDLQKETMRKTGKYLSILIIFDDMLSVKQKYSDEILQVYIRGRNIGMSIIMTSQTPALLSKDWRTNSDYVVLFFDKDVGNRTKNIGNFILSLYGGKVGTSKSKLYQEVDDLYLRVVKVPHQALVCDFIEGKLCRFKAE